MTKHYLILFGADNEAFLAIAVDPSDALDVFEQEGHDRGSANSIYELTEVDLPEEGDSHE
ncbi:hypothetical protein KXR64_16490 [Brucella intermedia]|uniref:hypothetical protein n=1 Tax=Brucella TaxID=234 RepID=UPI0011150E7E|nr:hypothetical protein [Brucella intermedia]